MTNHNCNLLEKTLIVIVGPTAVGKTSLAIRLAQHFNTEILSADSRQFYREMSVGTAKPDASEMQGIKHHFIDSLTVTQIYNAGDFERDALVVVQKLFEKRDLIIAAGGSGMYVKALCDGLDDMPEQDEKLREELNDLAESNYDSLLEKLKELDPLYYEQVDKYNKQRVVRALEVCIATKAKFSDFRKSDPKPRPFSIIKIGLEKDRELLYKDIDKRVDLMLEKGLLSEATALLAYKNMYALQTIGYTEIYGFLEGAYDWAECVRLLKRNSRRYAKKQLTWFKKDPTVYWVNVDSGDCFTSILSYIEFKCTSM